MPERVLVVEDDRELQALLRDLLVEAGYQAVAYASATAALRAIDEGETVDLVLSDLILPGMGGEELLRELRTRRPELNVIILTAFGSIDSAIEMVKAGAYDYLTKPVATDELLLSVERGLRESRARREAAASRLGWLGAPAGIVGASRPMQEVFSLLTRAAHSRHPVVISGESGTGKELVARALHQISGRGRFVAVNCGALPEHLLESELFGHERGAFTGAEKTKLGLFEAADKGTLLLDEIAELPWALQPKLLRALEGGEIRRVGSTEQRALDVRLVAATNRDLEEEVKLKRFREDLYWRLNVIRLHLPPLRERPSDILLLAEHFLVSDAGEPGSGGPVRRLALETSALLAAYPWPGNVRELRNAIQSAAAMTRGEEIRPEDLPPRIQESGRTAAAVSQAVRRHLALRDLERVYVLEILKEVGGNKSRAAEILGLDRKTLYRKLEEYRSEDPTLAL